MRLINIHTLELEEYFGDDIPSYAILSHTWGDEEVSFQDWQGEDHGAGKKNGGFQKILGACLMAERNGFEYLWVDTNCINKDSSAELSEAINSMFSWYEKAALCMVYLDDFHFESHVSLASFENCRWFTRGWTLQELLAPRAVSFFDASWIYVGNKTGLVQHICLATSIHMQYLLYPDTIFMASVARRMSWVAARRTTREEDMAYCMMGIFEINMPLLYGEGAKAFIRLQEEIIKHNNDQTIFCWSWDPYTYVGSWITPLWRGCFAPTPLAFRDSVDFVQCPPWSNPTYQDFHLSNTGLRISLPVLKCFIQSKWDGIVMLDATYSQHSTRGKGDRYERVGLCLSFRHSQVLTNSDFPTRLLNLPRQWAKTAVPLCLAHDRNPRKRLFHELPPHSVSKQRLLCGTNTCSF
jgi:hypothetical protein